jgi:hypothetical protein
MDTGGGRLPAIVRKRFFENVRKRIYELRKYQTHFSASFFVSPGYVFRQPG